MVKIKNNIEVPINKIGLNIGVEKKLMDNNIDTLEGLWLSSKADLLKKGFSISEINHISIKLQLYGIDLNKKIYGKN